MLEKVVINTHEDRFDGWAESPQIQSRLDDLLRGADDGDLYLQYTRSEDLGFSDGKLKTASLTARRGFGLQVACGEIVGFAHANEFSDAALSRAEDAVQMAKLGGSGVWDVSPARRNEKIYTEVCPLGSTKVDARIAALSAIDAYARGRDRRVQQVTVGLSASWTCVEILRAGGERYKDTRPLVQLRVSVMMADKGRMETGSSAIGGRYDLSGLLVDERWRAEVDEAIRMASVNLTSKPAPAGKRTVVLEAGWPGVMIHEAVGHGFEGDAIRKGESIYAGKVGEQVAAKGVTIVDNGALDHRRGSLSIDDEGTPTQENILIEDGILKGYMHDRLSARLMGVKPTGNGRRESYAHQTLPRMTNTYMKSGAYSRDEIISSVKEGIYAPKLGGGQVNPVSGDFVFQCTEAYVIRNGKIEEPVKGATLIGNGPSAMKDVSMVGDNSMLDTGMGVCGKAGQNIPVGVGQPTIRMENMTVGGTA